MHQEFRVCALEDLGALRFQGAEAVRFLQGQLSSDVLHLAPERSLLAGYHNPQGRTIALLRLVHLGADDVLAILPRELAAPVAQRLAKFVLRTKVVIRDDSAQWRIDGLICEMSEGVSPGTSALPLPAGAQRRFGETAVVCVGESPARWLEISPLTHPRQPKGPDPGAASGLELSPLTHPRQPKGPDPGAASGLELSAQVSSPTQTPAGGQPALPPAAPASRERWRELDVRAGLPQVYAPTSEQFVAQMLNLDAIGAIAFDKGCYTGQEVIARAHYRGRVKRRLQRFLSRGPLALAPGDTGSLPDGRSFTVVEAARLADGRCEFLAVARLPGAEPESGGAEAAASVDAQPLPLPYPLPE